MQTLDPGRQQFFSERLRLFSRQQPDLPKLRAKLLELGGLEMVPRPEDHLHILLAGGKRYTPAKLTLIPGRDSECHANSQEYARFRPEAKAITGWALTSEDGLWRQHSWCYVEGTGELIETTMKRELYWGVPWPILLPGLP